MSNSVLILGESGSGKSTSIRTLPPENTLIINVIGKPLPFRGYKGKYKALSADGKDGNYYHSDDPGKITRLLKFINDNRPDIQYIVLDDYGYTITNSFMRKAAQRGYEKYSDIGSDAFNVLEAVTSLRDDLFCFVMMHTEIDTHGKYKPKSVGKMIDQYICIEGKFTYVFTALVQDGNYVFLTNTDGHHLAKTSLGLFDELFIPNDLKLIADTIHTYNSEKDDTNDE
jgi:hypothetical protein